MFKILFRFIVLFFLNFAVLFYSSNENVYQLFLDLEKISLIKEFNETILYILISLSVPVLCLSLLFFLRPFIEIYLLHFLKFNFYFLINLLSTSTIYIVFRIYGYDRLNLLLYLITSSVVLYKSEKIKI